MAQEETLINKISNLGFYVSPNVQFGSVAGEGAGIFNFKGALTIQDNFAIGGMYGFTFNEFTPSVENTPNTYLDMQLGGLLLEYTLNPNKLVHFTFPLAIGAGEVQTDWKDDFGSDNDDEFGEESFFFVEPGAMLEINVLPNVRFNLGATYRIIPGSMDYRGLNAEDINGFTGSAGLKVGIF
jgi:hypothetical protein